MSPVELPRLADQLSRALLPYLDQLLAGNKPPSFLPGADLATLAWEPLAPVVAADPQLSARLNAISLRRDQVEARLLLAWELEHLLARLPTAEMEAVSRRMEQPGVPEQKGFEAAAFDPGDETWRRFDIEETKPAAPAGETLRGWDPSAPLAGLTESLGSELPGTEMDFSLAAAAAVETTTIEEMPTRYLRAEITEGDLSQPLPPNQEFTLAFFVDLEAGEEHDASLAFEEGGIVYQGGAASLQVLVASQDFIVHTRTPQELRVPRSGQSRNKARFDLEPPKDFTGVGEVTAVFYKDNNFIQGMTLRLNVGTGERVFATDPQGLGRPLDGLGVLQPRDLLLFIKKAADGFDLTMVGAVAAQAFLPLTPEALNEKITAARAALLEVVYLAQGAGGVFVQPMNKALPSGASLPYQMGLDIPTEIGKQGLQRLAEAGWLLFNDIFYGDGTRPDAHAMGDQLRTLACENTLKLQIISQEFFLPWGLLYLAEFVDTNQVDPENFLGMKHIIEHIPLQNRMQVHDERIPSAPQLAISLNLDTRIDAALKLNVIAEQRSFWDQFSANRPISLKLRQTSSEFLGDLSAASEQILYFYGHAISQGLGESGGSEGSSLSFSDQKNVTLRDLKLRAPARVPLAGAPLVFINACESAELSPLFYGGFMPYFMEKGARGMIGTECQVPAIFAAEWARRFFERFLTEERPIGELFLDLRREFYARHNNPLGLLYALYCDGDTRVTPGLKSR
jgi:hypothetical protein